MYVRTRGYICTHAGVYLRRRKSEVDSENLFVARSPGTRDRRDENDLESHKIPLHLTRTSARQYEKRVFLVAREYKYIHMYTNEVSDAGRNGVPHVFGFHKFSPW